MKERKDKHQLPPTLAFLPVCWLPCNFLVLIQWPTPLSWHTELDNVSAWSVHWLISMLSCSQSSPLVNGVSLRFWKALMQLTEQRVIQGRCSDNINKPQGISVAEKILMNDFLPWNSQMASVKNLISLQYSMAKQWYTCHTICSVMMSYKCK